ncbi:carbonate dehydratase [Bifidobacterium lemurum]|uniref:Carbonic anhydrase n=1 Tax=Bifidobacterium lemurum TaxID=1603886 RepID=A0A261FQR1_9BIFI|nr:carbonic anhydrase [Bifidobacterium lemurum]OZG61497.1 carbonate dehydratase [Bifidobacterium lemurum]
MEDKESTASATWSRMLQGNRRFAEGNPEHPWQDRITRDSLTHGQHPDAAVIACADSRVPPEIIFDQGLGDLFTVRTAGEVLDDAVIASLEYAIEQLHVSVLVVLGHEGCGAVKAAVDGIDALANEFDDCDCFHATDAAAHADPEVHVAHLAAMLAAQDSPIIREVGQSVFEAQQADLETAEDFERAHVARTIELLVERSEVIQRALGEGQLMIAGARYLLTTGKVEVLSF